MNIAGLSKLGLAPQAPVKSQGKASPKDAPASFEETLGQAQPQTKSPQPKSEQPKLEQPQAKVQSQTPQSKPESTVENKSMPSQPSAPVLDNPMPVSDRIMNTPSEIAPMTPMGKPQIATAKGEEHVDALTRRAVWNDFLRKMKDELGVSAEDVLSAFDSLSAEELAQPPAESVDKIVMALGLNPQQAPVAKQYFMDLIQRTQPKSMGDELAKSEKQISLTLMSQREVDRKNQNKAIDNLNQNFFMKGPYERPAAEAVAPVQGQMMPQKMAQTQRLRELNAQLGEQQPAPVPFTPSLDPNTRLTQMNEGKIAIPQEFQQAQSKPAKADVDSILKKFTEGQGQSSQVLAAGKESFIPQAQAMMSPVPMAPAQAAPAAVETGTTAAAKLNSSAEAAMQAIFGTSGGANGAAEQNDSEQQDFTSDASYLTTALPADGQKIGSGQPSEFQTQLNTVAPNQPMQVPDLVKNAQVMVREGGGEMKVTLTPDGLGEVAMKVSVKDGKVNVQMVTESDEAKRMIERSLGDLKSSLAVSNLQVSDIKIDTASNLGKQLEQQYSDAQRQAAQQNLEQFRQDHSGWRRSFFETPQAKIYKSQGEAPRDVQAPTSVAAARNRGGSRRLNLVA